MQYADVMPTSRITVTLEPSERQALSELAEQDVRDGKQTIVWLIREEARRRGMSFASQENDKSATTLAGEDALVTNR